MRSAPTTAASIFGVNDNLDSDAAGARPNLFRAGHAASTNRFRAASAFGATSVATTSRPFARKRAVQLAPMTPVPMMATRRMGLVVMVNSPWMRCSDFGVGDACEVALSVAEVALVFSIEIGGIERSGKVSHKHPIARDIERNANPFHQVRQHNLRRF